MVRSIGLEPTTPTMSRWCSNQLSYERNVVGDNGGSEIKAGRKIFKMNVTGNIYTQSGDLLMYNISIARDPDSAIKFPVVKNVIKGCMSKYDIDEITFFVGGDIKFSGSYERFMQTSQYDQSPELFEMRNQMLDGECLKSQVFNGHNLYLLLPENMKIKALEEQLLNN